MMHSSSSTPSPRSHHHFRVLSTYRRRRRRRRIRRTRGGYSRSSSSTDCTYSSTSASSSNVFLCLIISCSCAPCALCEVIVLMYVSDFVIRHSFKGRHAKSLWYCGACNLNYSSCVIYYVCLVSRLRKSKARFLLRVWTHYYLIHD